jgi:hypothetical protein
VEVGENARRFLESMDNFDYRIPIWMDSICINQVGLIEKSHQIPLMGAIYSQATRVIIFLGVPRPEDWGHDLD